MATNFRNFSGPALEVLNTADLAVGDILIQADWNFTTGSWRETSWTIAKVLKTRLVLTRTVPLEGAYVADLNEARVIVENSKSWPRTNGNVTTRLEGESGRYTNATYYFTPDEPKLAELREQVRIVAEKWSARHTARHVIEKLTNNPRTFTPDDALEAIAALQAFVIAHKEN